MKNISVLAPAKINLFLDIVNKREDGYHNIRSVMQTVSLFDKISIVVSDKISVSTTDTTLPCDESNLAFKAASLFFKEASIKSGCKIHIEKNIPISSGLAGGSTDAAAVLKGLNRLFDYPLTTERLTTLSSSLGADIPFCLIGGTCLCEGIGDKLTELEDIKETIFLVVRGGEGVSTPSAYKKLDSIGTDFDSIELYNHFIQNIKLDFTKSMYNIFEKAVLPVHSCANIIKETLLDLNATSAMLSGSGPAVFAFFPDIQTGELAKSKMIEMGYKAFLCKNVNKLQMENIYE